MMSYRLGTSELSLNFRLNYNKLQFLAKSLVQIYLFHFYHRLIVCGLEFIG